MTTNGFNYNHNPRKPNNPNPNNPSNNENQLVTPQFPTNPTKKSKPLPQTQTNDNEKVSSKAKVTDIHTPTPPPTLPTLYPKAKQTPPKSPHPIPNATPPQMLNPTPGTGVEEGNGFAGLKNAWNVLMESKHRNGKSPSSTKNNASRSTSAKKQLQPKSKVEARSTNQKQLGKKLNSGNLMDQPSMKCFLEQKFKALSHNSFPNSGIGIDKYQNQEDRILCDSVADFATTSVEEKTTEANLCSGMKCNTTEGKENFRENASNWRNISQVGRK